jgi:hypothetical protein
MKNYKYKHIAIVIIAIGIIMVTLLPSGGINNFLCGAFAVLVAAIALRSVLFLFFDRSPADSEVDE